MFQEGNYNVLEFNPPTQGMNCNLAPEVLPQAFASVLENILPTPVGSSVVRYGTKRLAGMNLDADAVIIEAFPYVKANGDTQMVLYVQTFVQDLSASNFEVLSPDSFSFTTNSPDSFAVDTPIKVSYTWNGTTHLYSAIVSKIVAENTVTIAIQDNSFPQLINDELPFPQAVEVNSVAFSQGSLYVYDRQTSTLGAALKTGLSVACVPRSVTFLNTLLICNGVDRVLRWDGTTLLEVIDFVNEDTATNFTRINDTHFSFGFSPMKAAVFDITKYQNNNQIQLNIQGIITTTTVVNIGVVNNLVTITTADILPAFTNPPQLFYRDWPPSFSFMIVAHNRLWGLGAGAVGLNYRDPNQALVVYFSYQPNTLTNWFDEKLKIVPFIDLAQTHGVPDNIEAIASVSGLTIFMGRNATQVWTGSEPLGAAAPDPTRPKFVFSSILPIGIVHGNLVVEMANDVYFVSQNGLLSFSTLNLTKQLAATASDAVDPLVRQYVTATTTSNQAYRACRSFKYKSGAFCGFKIGLNKVLVSLYSTNLYAWSLFSGDFAKAATFLATLDNALYLSVGNQIYQYADGTKDTPPVYGDNNGQDLINFLWTLPVVHLSGKRWANKRYELQVAYPSSFVLGLENNLSILMHGDIHRTFSLSDNYPLPFKGDILQTIPLVASGVPDPNEPNARGVGFRLDEPYAFPKDRLKFLSSSFGVSLFGSTKDGKLYFKKIRLFGIAERSS